MFGWGKGTSSGTDMSVAGHASPTRRDARLSPSSREREEAQEVSLVGKVQNSDSAVVVVLGGINLQEPDDISAGKSTYVFKPQLNQWLTFQPLPEPRHYHAVVYYAGCIFVIGGYSPIDVVAGKGEARAQRSVFKFGVREKKWDRVADMLHARACHGATVVNEKIMVVGGKDHKGEILQSVEVYNPASDAWVPYRNLPLPLMGCGVAYLAGMVYVVGGVTTKKQVFTGMVPAEVLSTVHATDTNERTWVRRPSLPEPRAYCTALTIHHELWLAGGLKPSGRDPTGFTNVADVLAFDSLRGRWEFRFKLSRPRHAVAAASADDRVYVLGGMSCLDGTSVEDVDVYHRQRLTFLDCECLPKKLTGLAAVTVPPESTDGSGLKSGPSSRAPSSLKLDQGDQDKKRRPHKPVKSVYDDKDRSTEEIEVSPDVRKKTPHPRPRTDAGDVDDSTQGAHWPPGRLALESSTFLGVQEMKLRTPLSRPSMPRFYHYVPVAPRNDPHHGITVRVDDDFKRTKEVLGLRDASGLPPFARKLRRVKQVQDETLPVILTFGGLDPRDPLNYANGRVVLHYHVLKNRWDLCGMMPEPRSYHAAVLIGNTVYVTGGFDPDTRKCGELVACKTTYAYDIDSMEWSRKADMKMGRAAHGAACFHDRILVFGGRGRFGRAVASTEEYDPASDTWKECTPLDVPRMAVGCATVGDVIYVVGGMIPETGDFYRAVDRVDIYCPKTHTWSEGPPLPKPRAFPAAACLDGKLWLVGGCYDNSEPGLPLVSLRDVDVLEPSGWVHVGCTVHSRHAAAIAVADTNIYVIGGTSSVLNGPLKRPEVYLQLDDCYKFPAEYPEAMTGMSAVCVPPAKPTFRSQSLTCMVKDRLAE
ncbi:alpha-scruin-like [Amblyomma americanum]